VEIIWQIPIHLQMSLDRFSGPASFGTIVSRRVLISLRIPYGRVPSAGLIWRNKDWDKDLDKDLGLK